MDEAYLQVRACVGEGYRPLVDFGAWRVASLRYLDELYPPAIERFERHLTTDEVFVLLAGQGTLLLAGHDLASFQAVPLERATLYNVRQGCWHGLILSRDASVLLVENRDTTAANSEYAPLQPWMRARLLAAARAFPDWAYLPPAG
jgi:hypothetical protein